MTRIDRAFVVMSGRGGGCYWYAGMMLYGDRISKRIIGGITKFIT
jgi:hypothetical protein